MLPGWIVFDAVGTLILPAEPVARVYQQVGRLFDVDLTTDEIERRFSEARAAHFPARTNCVTSEAMERERWRRVVIDVFWEASNSKTLFDELWRHFARPESWSVPDDVAPALSLSRAAGIDVAIASNFDHRLVPICRSLEELYEIKEIHYSAHIGFCKPDSRFYQCIACELGASPERLLMIGDSRENDVAAARRAGWNARLLDRSKADLVVTISRVITDDSSE